MPLRKHFQGAFLHASRRKLQTEGIVYLVLSIGLLLSIAAWYLAERALQQNVQTYFDFRVKQLLATIDNRIENYQQVLYGARGLFAASKEVDRDEFKDYVAALNLTNRYPGIQGVGFALIVPKAQKQSHTEAMQQQGFPTYAIYPDGERDIYTSIIYLEPFSGRNLRAFAYDMFTEPTRQQAMVYARDTNTIGMTAKVTLVQEIDSDIQAGFLMYLPVYQNHQPHDNQTQHRAHIIGWVYSPFRIRDFMVGIGGERGKDLHLSIYDGEHVSAESLMYSDQSGLLAGKSLDKTITLPIGGHVWTLQIRSETSLKNWLSTYQPLMILISGICLSILISLLLRQSIARGQALAMAAATNQELQESESRFRLLADSAPVLIWLTDANQSAIWFNKPWLTFTGRTLADELGQGWLSSVEPAQQELVFKLLKAHFLTRKPFQAEYRVKRADGNYRWIINAGVPRFNIDGEFVGFIGSCIDITQHKEMEEELWGLATTDGLTGFLNRRHFLALLQAEFDRMQRNAELRSSVLMLDLDHFKRINDDYGHAIGDEVLKHFSQIIRSQQRRVDVIGRLGGEEFAIILPDTNLAKAHVLAERLRQAVAHNPLIHETTTIAVTVSIGIALLQMGSRSAENVLKEADHALYQAKHAGRNQVATTSS